MICNIMNQIITKAKELEILEPNSNIKVGKERNKYFLQFLFSFTFAIIFLLLLFYHFYKNNEKEQISKQLLKNYSLTTLYQDNTYDAPEIEKTSTLIQNPFVIGMVRIEKIDLNYPILSKTDKELLKISLCRFAGPMPNEYGNLCIAGHNYVDNKFFSNLNKLNKNDLIEIYDLNGNKVVYSIFDKYEVDINDLSCTSQEVGNKRIVTLLTCNNVNGKRTVIHANELT